MAVVDGGLVEGKTGSVSGAIIVVSKSFLTCKLQIVRLDFDSKRETAKRRYFQVMGSTFNHFKLSSFSRFLFSIVILLYKHSTVQLLVRISHSMTHGTLNSSHCIVDCLQ